LFYEVIMLEKERRNCPRYSINFPIIIDSSRGLASKDGWHYGEILDAGKEGVRMRVEDFGSLTVGAMLQLICQPADNRKPKRNSIPVPIKGKVVWQDEPSRQFALQYVH
jgi:hypothetical protein